jgi:hypothetical protein
MEQLRRDNLSFRQRQAEDGIISNEEEIAQKITKRKVDHAEEDKEEAE